MRALVLVMAFASPAMAGDWAPLDTSGIETALDGQSLDYQDGSSQVFYQDGRTLYRAGAGESWGKWWAAENRYCSTWPPSETPACYKVEASDAMIRFVGTDGSLTLGQKTGK